MAEGKYWLRKIGKGYISWHSYKTKELREKWAATYVARGYRVVLWDYSDMDQGLTVGEVSAAIEEGAGG